MNYENHDWINLQHFYFIKLFFIKLFHQIVSKDSWPKYYQNNKKGYKKKLVKDIKVLPRKNKKESGCEQQKHLSEDEKQKPVEYTLRKRYSKMRSNCKKLLFQKLMI